MTDHASQPRVLVICGSASDIPALEPALDLLASLGIAHELRVLSAHRTPDEVVELARSAHGLGFRAIIAAAGLAAHLPGVVASHTTLPVIGLPIAAGPLSGADALHSIVQMPPGIPVMTVGIGNGANAALAAARVLALGSPSVAAALDRHIARMRTNALSSDCEHARTVTCNQEEPAHA